MASVYDDHKPRHENSMAAYEMSSMASRLAEDIETLLAETEAQP